MELHPINPSLKHNLFFQQASLEELGSLVVPKIQDILNLDEKQLPILLLLEADVGMGKTTFTQKLFTSLGLPKDKPVTSPTFNYKQEYQLLDEKKLAHYDLYRIDEFDEISCYTLFENIEDYLCVIVEWPKNELVPFLRSHFLIPQIYSLTISQGPSTDTRLYTLSNFITL